MPGDTLKCFRQKQFPFQGADSVGGAAELAAQIAQGAGLKIHVHRAGIQDNLALLNLIPNMGQLALSVLKP